MIQASDVMRQVAEAQRSSWYPRTVSGRDLADAMVSWFVSPDDDWDFDAWQMWVGLIRQAEQEAA